MTVGRDTIFRIFEYREGFNLSEAEISKRLGLAKNTVISVLRNKKMLSSDWVEREKTQMFKNKQLCEYLLKIYREEVYNERLYTSKEIYKRYKSEYNYSRSYENFNKQILGFRSLFQILDRREFIKALLEELGDDFINSAFIDWGLKENGNGKVEISGTNKQFVQVINLINRKNNWKFNNHDFLYMSEVDDSTLSDVIEHVNLKLKENLNILCSNSHPQRKEPLTIEAVESKILSTERDYEEVINVLSLAEKDVVFQAFDNILVIRASLNELIDEQKRRQNLKPENYYRDELVNIFLNTFEDALNSKKLTKERLYSIVNSLILKFFSAQYEIRCSDTYVARYDGLTLMPVRKYPDHQGDRRCPFLDEANTCKSGKACENTGKIKKFIQRKLEK